MARSVRRKSRRVSHHHSRGRHSDPTSQQESSPRHSSSHKRRSSQLPDVPPLNKDEDELGIKPWILTGRRTLLPPDLASKYAHQNEKDGVPGSTRRKTEDWTNNMGSIEMMFEGGTGAAYAPIKLNRMSGVLPGLEVLHGIKAVFMRQELEPIQFLRGYELKNRFSVFNPFGQRIYFAGEIASCCNRFCLCCAESRPFTLNLFDASGEIVFRIERRCNCLLCCFGSNIAGGSCSVYLRGTNQIIGKVKENCSCSTPSFSVYDKEGTHMMQIVGPTCSSLIPCYLGGNIVFQINNPKNGAAMGTIMKKFAMREILTDSNDFGFSILEDTDEITKAVLVGAVFCIDFTFFGSEPADSDKIHWKWGCWKCSMCTVLIELVFVASIVIVIIYLVRPDWFKVKIN